MKAFLKNIFLVIIILLLISAVFSLVNPKAFQTSKEISLSELADKVNVGSIKQINVSGSEIKITLETDEKITSRKETGVSLEESLAGLGVEPEKLRAINIIIEKENQGLSGWLFPCL